MFPGFVESPEGVASPQSGKGCSPHPLTLKSSFPVPPHTPKGYNYIISQRGHRPAVPFQFTRPPATARGFVFHACTPFT